MEEIDIKDFLILDTDVNNICADSNKTGASEEPVSDKPTTNNDNIDKVASQSTNNESADNTIKENIVDAAEESTINPLGFKNIPDISGIKRPSLKSKGIIKHKY